ncbi:molybdopterin dinucleotide-binding protein [Gordonibacter sp. An230]|uniref:molybdopterin-containing oxidoreductase family protein n=1 Tax=Gordonibacter sp. An230 TaxID=1965592 RepID=UPI000B37CDA2|nr:molybdopterin-dependent oxidoreductase [Gordonibacter sp. An230]OUO89834.1 molybdopterin dinucleotide-binding protein [Gordonibacter sp. An230]
MTRANLSRRTFVQGALLAGAAAAVGASMSGCMTESSSSSATIGAGDQRKKVEYDEIKKTCCHGCLGHCPVLAYLKDGVVVKLMGDPNGGESRGSICPKCLNQLQTMYSPRRILHPLRRAGERGENKWEIISWDEAIEEAATHIVDTIDKYGPYAFFGSTGGGGSYSSNQIKTTCVSLGSPNIFEPGAAQCLMPRVCATVFMVGDNQTQSVADSMSTEFFKVNDNASEVIVIWGAQPSVSQTAQSGRGMAELRANGVKTVVIDPNFSPDATKADVWLPIRPGTDTALMLCWFRYIFENKLYNKEFTKYWTNLPFLIDPDTKLPVLASELFPDFAQSTPDDTPAYVCFDLKTNALTPFEFSAPKDALVDPEVFWEGEVNGKTYRTAGKIYADEADPWTLEHTADICWLEADKIEAAIRLYTHADDDGTTGGICHGVATDQHPQSSEASIGAIGLDIIMGYINKPGASITKKGPASIPMKRTTQNAPQTMTKYGCCAIPGLSDAANQARMEKAAQEMPEIQKMVNQMYKDGLGTTAHKGLHTWFMVHIPSVLQAITTGEPYKPRLWFDVSGNKLAMLANASSWYDAISEIDYCICQYPMLTSFHVEAADLVFPTREWLEEPLTDHKHLNMVFLQNECTHIGETVSHSIPTAQILERCKEKWGGTLPGVPNAYVGEATEEAVKASCAKTFGAESWDDLQANIDTYVPKVTPEDKYYVYNQHEMIVDDGLPAGFGTESRKLEPYASLYLKLARTGYPYTYPEPQDPCDDYSPICTYVEPAESPLTDEEFPLVLTSGRVPYFHHGTMRHSAFARELFPTAEIRINPATAAEHGIAHMDWVKVSSRRGSISARAYLTEGVNPRCVWMERFWNPECFDESQPNKTAGWRECNVNVLTKSDAPFNPAIGTYTNRGFTVKIEKGEKPANIWTEAREFQPFMPTLQSEPVTKDVI